MLTVVIFTDQFEEVVDLLEKLGADVSTIDEGAGCVSSVVDNRQYEALVDLKLRLEVVAE